MDESDLLTLHGETGWCEECGDERLFVPVPEDHRDAYCCTRCDSAVFWLPLLDDLAPAVRGHRRSA